MARKEPTAPPAYWNPEEMFGLDQPPPYQEYPAGYHPPTGFYPPNQSCYFQGQPNGAPYGPPPAGEVQHSYMDPQIVTRQSTVFVPSGVKPQPDYLCFSVFTMLCCCFPMGFLAIIFSRKARDANLMGNNKLARKNSRTALMLSSIALVFGLTATVLFIYFFGFHRKK